MSKQDLDQNAIDSLFGVIEKDQRAIPVNFAERRSLTAEQMKTLINLNLPFTSILSAHLSSWLDSKIKLSMVAAERILYRDQLDMFAPEGMYLSEGRFEDLGVSALLQIDVQCVDAIVHLGLGGRDQLAANGASRELTRVDVAIMEIFLKSVWKELNHVWSACGLQASFERRVLPGDVLKVFHYSEYLLSFTYSITIGAIEGFLQLSLSTTVTDILLREIDRQEVRRPQSPEIKKLLQQRLSQIPQRGFLRLPPFSIEIATIRELKPGTLLTTGIPSTEPARLSFSGGPELRATAMQRSGRVVAEVLGMA